VWVSSASDLDYTARVISPSVATSPPGPDVRGFFPKLALYYRFSQDAVGVVGERFDTFGDVYRVPGKTPLYVCKHPEQIYEILVERAADFDKGHSAFERLSQVLGSGLLTSDGDRWRRHRRMMQPAFQRARLVGYTRAMAEESELLEARLGEGELIDMGDAMMTLTLAIVSRTLFSHDVAKESGSVSAAMTAFQDSITRPDVLPRWVPDPGRKRIQRAVRDLDQIIYGLIGERRREREANPTKERDDLLERLMAAEDEEGDGARLTETEIRDELVTLFLAGHETTAQTLTWTWYLLSQHPEIQKRLHAELDSVLGGRTPTYDDLEGLPYTDQVVSEALRLYPPVYLIARRAIADTKIGGYDIEKNAELALWVYLTQRDARWFERPEQFRPERFRTEARASIPRGAYLPFGLGPRTCIGKTFALIEARIILATLAQRFRFELASGQRIGIRPRITLTPKYGMRMRALRR
jgi:cytochrome P450